MFVSVVDQQGVLLQSSGVRGHAVVSGVGANKLLGNTPHWPIQWFLTMGRQRSVAPVLTKMSFRSCETLRDACWGSLCSSGNERGNMAVTEPFETYDHFICWATNAVLVPDMSNVSNDIASVEDSELCLNWQGLVSLDWAVFCIMFWPALARVSSASSKFKYKNKKLCLCAMFWPMYICQSCFMLKFQQLLRRLAWDSPWTGGCETL